MTSKEMEARSGVPRANIRYYEAEGLLHPARAKNGYREYSEADLAVLEKIKLLRRLGVSVEELRSLRSGTETLTAVLDRRLAELGGEQASLERVRQVCGAVRATAVSFGELDAGPYLRDLDAPSLPESGEGWWRNAPPPSLPEGDALPTVCSIPRRLTARLLDQFLLSLVLLMMLCLAGYNPARVNTTLMQLVNLAVLAVLEPLFLRLFAATPGKALMGLRLTEPDGGRLSFSRGFNHYIGMLWYGVGFCLPIWSLVQLYRSAKRCSNDEPQPWDEGIAYQERPFLLRNLVATMVTLVLFLGVGEAVNSASQLPPNRGELTVAEFAENYNRQASYLGVRSAGWLDPEGLWHEAQDLPNDVSISIGDSVPGAEQFRYTVENGRLTAVTLSGGVENSHSWYALPTAQMALALTAFAWAQEDAPFWTGPRRAQLAALDEADWQEGFTLRQGELDITLTTEVENFTGFSSGYAVPSVETGDNRFAFTFTMALES